MSIVRTGEGRTLCVLLSIYAFAVFGYVTAALASFFIGRGAARDDASVHCRQPRGGHETHRVVSGITTRRPYGIGCSQVTQVP